MCPHPNCNARFSKLAYLKSHYVTHSKHRSFVCQICSKSYLRPDHLKRHLLTCRVSPEEKESMKKYVCRICSKRFMFNYGLNRHLKRCHAKVLRKAQASGEQPTSFPKKPQQQQCIACPNCAKEFKTQAQYEVHQKSCSSPGVYICGQPNCGKVFSTNLALAAHFRTDHELTVEEHSPTSPSPAYECQNCGKLYTSLRYFRQHMIQHHQLSSSSSAVSSDKLKYPCPVDGCDRRYTEMKNLKSHIRANHSSTLPFPCPMNDCPSAFGYSQVLKRHLRQVHGHPCLSTTTETPVPSSQPLVRPSYDQTEDFFRIFGQASPTRSLSSSVHRNNGQHGDHPFCPSLEELSAAAAGIQEVMLV